MWLERLITDWQTPDLRDWRGWAANPDDLLLIAGCLVMLGMMLYWSMRSSGQTPSRQVAAGDSVERATNTPLLRRLWWRIRPPADLMQVDGLMIDRTGKRSHALWPGPTGAGKSESVATVRCDGARPWLAVMPDISDPLRRRADFIWTAGESQTPIDFLNGTPEDVAERLTTIFRSGGNGVWMMAAREAATHVIRNLDNEHEPRSLQAIGSGIEALVDANRRLKTACEGWVTRFLATAMAMGPSVAAGGVDIAELLRAGKGVVIDNDRWKHPALCGDTVAFGLAEAKRIGDLVPGGFRLIFEEADQLGERIDLADPFFAAGRRRCIAVDALLHAEEDADDAMATNSATRVYFRPNKPEQRAKVAKALDLSEAKVDAIPDYHAWIEHDGKVRRLVRFPKPPRAPQTPVSVTDTLREDLRTPQNGHARRTVIVELPQEREALPALPPPSTEYSDLMRYIYKDGECERWSGKHDRAGHVQGCADGCSKRHVHKVGCSTDCHDAEHERNCYGLVWWPLAEPTPTRTHEWQRVHRVRWRLAYGPIPVDPKTGRSQTIDHRRTCAKDCSSLGHINGPVSIGENVLRMHRGRGHNTSGQAAGAGR